MKSIIRLLIVLVIFCAGCSQASSVDMEKIKTAIIKDSGEFNDIQLLGEGISDMDDYNVYCVITIPAHRTAGWRAFLVNNYFGYWSALWAYDYQEWDAYGCSKYSDLELEFVR